jgi:hypothetical protein
MAEVSEGVAGAAMWDEVGKSPALATPEAPPDAGWRLDRAGQRFALGALLVELRLEAAWSWVSPQVDGRAPAFALNALQQELDEAARQSPAVRRAASLEKALEAAASKVARRDELLEARRPAEGTCACEATGARHSPWQAAASGVGRGRTVCRPPGVRACANHLFGGAEPGGRWQNSFRTLSGSGSEFRFSG